MQAMQPVKQPVGCPICSTSERQSMTLYHVGLDDAGHVLCVNSECPMPAIAKPEWDRMVAWAKEVGEEVDLPPFIPTSKRIAWLAWLRRDIESREPQPGFKAPKPLSIRDQFWITYGAIRRFLSLFAP